MIHDFIINALKKYLSIILLEFSISIKFKKLHKNSSPYTGIRFKVKSETVIYQKRES